MYEGKIRIYRMEWRALEMLNKWVNIDLSLLIFNVIRRESFKRNILAIKAEKWQQI